MKPEPITWKTWGLALVLLATLVLGIAICGGSWGPSDLEMRVRASEPLNLEP
jgi:hypothetical protein